ncbi:MAG: protein translocase subunit SecD [Desulfobulbaceae bacterium]|nr:protein translocase subunit SecD [Desulfobulbaceae bacterium]HIJ78183.1 protein translocase subunit SecD [Deltaproteobacteria bacterium]
MPSSLRWKAGLLFFMIMFSVMTVLPSFKSVPDWWAKYLAPGGLRLGLDLQGGMHLVMKVNLAKAIENNLDLAAQDLKEALAEKKITVVRTSSPDKTQVILTLPNTGALDTVKQVLKDDFPELDSTIQAEEGSFPRIFLSLNAEKIDFINNNAVNQSLEIIRNRIDQFGVAEPVIVRQGADEIIIQLPGVKDADRALSLIGRTAQLEFKLVDDAAGLNLNQLINQAVQAGQWAEGESRRKLNLALQNALPAGSELYFEKDVDKKTGKETKTPILIKSQVLLTGEMVKDAQVRVGGNFNEPYVSLDFTGRGGKIFGQVTEKNVNKRFAIVLDEVVRSAPVIREKIMGGSAQISGSFSYEEAADLAIVLRVGALPAPVEIIQNLTVGASLGKDSIQKGLMSGVLGTILVLIFMMIYYRLSGLIANAALILNVLMLFAGLAMMGGTLTLPGIAGIILSIGMAVDSNVLIFERMREEFALGKTVKSGIEGGYDKAFWTIVDSQVTTLITALALFMFGTGPIKGFAVTLSLGVSLNLLTTLFGTRLIYDLLYYSKRLKPLKFLQFIKKPNLDFMGIRKFTITISAILVLIGLFSFVEILLGQANLGVDFSGGTIVQYKSSAPFTLKEVRQALDNSQIEGAVPQQVENENRLIIKVKKSEKVVGHITKEVTELLNNRLPDKNFEIESQSEIGSSVSDVLRNKALLAIAISLLGVIFYLAMRFDMTFGVAAAAATFHDVLVVLGLCWLMDMEITLLIVTALLTLAGYSLNDSVVVFDRIRENMNKAPGTSFAATINNSVNEVLGRTIVTSLTTGLVLVALYVWGGSVIHDFSFALLAGLVVGTYSSIFVASPLLHLWRRD